MPKSSKSKPAVTTASSVPAEVSRASAKRNALGSKCNWIFEVDYSINSRRPRFFVYNVTTKEFYKYKCAHGSGGANGSPHDGKCREVSNKAGSECSSLGDIRTGEYYRSEKVGAAVRLDGLTTGKNDNMMDRGVVLHGGAYVHDNASNSDDSICGRSYGCIVVDDQYINKTTGGELIEWLRDGSIGVCHSAGNFTL